MSQQTKPDNFAKSFAPNRPPPKREIRPKLPSAETPPLLTNDLKESVVPPINFAEVGITRI